MILIMIDAKISQAIATMMVYVYHPFVVEIWYQSLLCDSFAKGTTVKTRKTDDCRLD
jgi:hypothetical protein